MSCVSIHLVYEREGASPVSVLRVENPQITKAVANLAIACEKARLTKFWQSDDPLFEEERLEKIIHFFSMLIPGFDDKGIPRKTH